MYCPNVNRRFIPPCGGKADTKRMLIGMTCALGVSRSAETCRRWWSGREAISFSSRLVNAQLRCAEHMNQAGMESKHRQAGDRNRPPKSQCGGTRDEQSEKLYLRECSRCDPCSVTTMGHTIKPRYQCAGAFCLAWHSAISWPRLGVPG